MLASRFPSHPRRSRPSAPTISFDLEDLSGGPLSQRVQHSYQLRKASLLSVVPELTEKPMRLPPPVPQSVGRAPGFVAKKNVSGIMRPSIGGWRARSVPAVLLFQERQGVLYTSHRRTHAHRGCSKVAEIGSAALGGIALALDGVGSFRARGGCAPRHACKSARGAVPLLLATLAYYQLRLLDGRLSRASAAPFRPHQAGGH